MGPSWAVVSTMDEPAQLVVTFAAYHLSIGASEVHVYLDQPDPEAMALLSRLPNCIVTVCDKAFWKASRMGKRPLQHFNRQMMNAEHAYARTQADWILHCDADEYVADATGLPAELAAAPAQVMYLKYAMAERVGLVGHRPDHIFEGVFRMPFKEFNTAASDVFGHSTGFFRNGITGHAAGKSIVRAHAGMVPAVHAPRGNPPMLGMQSSRLLHFDGLTRLHYMIKLLRRAYEPPGHASKRHGMSRVTQFESLKESVSDYEYREALVTTLKELDPAQADRLRSLGYLDERGFDPRPALAHFGIEVDLSVATFDSYLRKRYAKFLREVAPDLLVSAADEVE